MATPDEFKEVMDSILTKKLLDIISKLADIAEDVLKEIAVQSGMKDTDFVIAEVEAQSLSSAERMHALLLTWATLRNTPPSVNYTND
jgi:hypothetical protein